MRVYLYKTDEGKFVPASEDDANTIGRMKRNVYYRADIKRERDGGTHRRFMRMVQWLLNYQNKYTQIEPLLSELKIKAGHYQELVVPKNNLSFDLKEDERLILMPKSISYDQMPDEEEFKQFFSKVVDVILSDYLKGDTIEEMDELAQQVLRFYYGR